MVKHEVKTKVLSFTLTLSHYPHYLPQEHYTKQKTGQSLHGSFVACILNGSDSLPITKEEGPFQELKFYHLDTLRRLGAFCLPWDPSAKEVGHVFTQRMTDIIVFHSDHKQGQNQHGGCLQDRKSKSLFPHLFLGRRDRWKPESETKCG